MVGLLLCVIAVALVGAVAFPMHPLGSEMIWKVTPVSDTHTENGFTNSVPETFLKSSWGNCSKAMKHERYYTSLTIKFVSGSTKISTVLSITSEPDPLVRGSGFTIYAKVRLGKALYIHASVIAYSH